jgi:hypothetical protein
MKKVRKYNASGRRESIRRENEREICTVVKLYFPP